MNLHHNLIYAYVGWCILFSDSENLLVLSLGGFLVIAAFILT